MIRDDYITFTGAQYLREMFNRTTDGKLTIGDGEGKLATFPMDWDGQTAEMLVQRYDNLLERLPYNRRSPIYLINRARRYERLVSLKAPAVVLRSEARCLAEEMALYYCLKSNAYICRCCGNGYDLGSNGGYIDYSICPVCYWEEDGCGEDEDSDTNGDTLRNYRKKFYAKQSGEIA